MHTSNAYSKPDRVDIDVQNPGPVLRSRRAFLGYSQEELADRTADLAESNGGADVSQRAISDLENGKISPLSLKSGRLVNYIKALGWSASAFTENTGIDVTFFERDPEPSLAKFEVSDEGLTFPVYGTVSAGTGDSHPEEGESATIARRFLQRAGVEPESVRVFVVNGSCMVSDYVRKAEKNIAEGDHIAVALNHPPPEDPRTVVCYFDYEEERLFIKHLKLEPDVIHFYPASGTGKTIARDKDDPQVRYIGWVFWRGGNL